MQPGNIIHLLCSMVPLPKFMQLLVSCLTNTYTKRPSRCLAEPFACHSERSEESAFESAQGKLRADGPAFLLNSEFGILSSAASAVSYSGALAAAGCLQALDRAARHPATLGRNLNQSPVQTPYVL